LCKVLGSIHSITKRRKKEKKEGGREEGRERKSRLS
jgi:hypothetical protein